MATYVPAKRGVAYILYVSLEATAGGTFQANPTISTGDCKLSKDGGTLTNLTDLPTVTPAGAKLVKVTLSATEMEADNATLVFSDAAGAEWLDLTVNIQTTATQIDNLVRSATPANALVVDAAGLADANMVKAGPTGSGTAQTARDIGASVLLSSGTGAGQLDLTSGAVVLASDGLDSIATTAPTGVASNFREMLVALWRRSFKKNTLTATQLKTYADNGTDVLTTQTVADNGVTQTMGSAT